MLYVFRPHTIVGRILSKTTKINVCLILKKKDKVKSANKFSIFGLKLSGWLGYPTRQPERKIVTVHHVVEEELSTQPTIILFFAGCFDRGKIFWGVTALFPQRACLFVMVYSRGHARDQGVCGAGSHKHLYFHSQHGFQNHLHRYQVSFIDEIRGYS